MIKVMLADFLPDPTSVKLTMELFLLGLTISLSPTPNTTPR
jgi:hypothetical protein